MLERIYVEIGNVCNLNCSFCHKTKREKRVMSTDEFKLVASKIKGKVKYVYLHILGEPLLHKNLPEILETARENGLKICITTNGTLLKEKGELLINCGAVYKVSVSLHAPEGNGETEIFEYLKEATVFSKKAAEKGIYTVFRLWNKDSAQAKGKNIQNKFIESFLKSHFTEDWRSHGRGQRLAKNIFLEYDGVFTWPADSKSEKSDGFCYGLSKQLGILADGTAVPCCLDADGDIPLGNIFKDDLDEILNSKRASDIKNGFLCGRAVEPFCQKCTFKSRFNQ